MLLQQLVFGVTGALLFLYPFSTIFTTYSSTSVLPVEPDVADKELVLSLAELAANAYHYPDKWNQTVWRNSTDLFTYEYSYGWDVDGLRGHIFKSRKDPVIVLSVKGTSLNSQKDKESANLICSCNCCFSNCTNQCDKERLVNSLPNMYLSLLLIAFEDVKERYSDHSIWFTGHSMGSVIASLAAVKTCNPAVGFSAPGEQLFSDRIQLDHKCPLEHKKTIHHFGYYKDPIFVGNCGWLCTVAGYRMESKCHHGTECLYTDTEGGEEEEEFLDKDKVHKPEQDLGSGMIRTHTINFLIDKVIKKQDKVPICIPVQNCTETCSI